MHVGVLAALASQSEASVKGVARTIADVMNFFICFPVHFLSTSFPLCLTFLANSMAEMILGYPLFRGRDNNDQLTQIMRIIGTPDDRTLRKINVDSVRHLSRSCLTRRASHLLSNGSHVFSLYVSSLYCCGFDGYASAGDCSSTLHTLPETTVPDTDTASHATR